MVTCTRGLKRGCPMQDGKVDNKNNNKNPVVQCPIQCKVMT